MKLLATCIMVKLRLFQGNGLGGLAVTCITVSISHFYLLHQLLIVVHRRQVLEQFCNARTPGDVTGLIDGYCRMPEIYRQLIKEGERPLQIAFIMPVDFALDCLLRRHRLRLDAPDSLYSVSPRQPALLSDELR